MFKVKKIEKIENDSLNSLETENSTRPRKCIFFTYTPLPQKFLQKKKLLVISKKNKMKKDKKNIFKMHGFWNKSEHNKFIEALYLYNCAWTKIESYLKNRTYKQIRSHAQKFYLKLKSFKDEELELDFTSPHVNDLKDIIKIIKEKEIINESCGKLLYIISEKTSFGQKIRKHKINKKLEKKIKKVQIKNCGYKNENINNNEKSNNINKINFEDFLIETMEKNNQNQDLNFLEYNSLLSNDKQINYDNALSINSDIGNEPIFLESILSFKNI